MAFTGMKLESHSIIEGRKICALYTEGKRVGTVFFNPEDRTVRIVHDPELFVRVTKVPGPRRFEDQ
jgi:hypothetical protein